MFYVIRHGERADLLTTTSEISEVVKPDDPPLTTAGHDQSYQTGLFLKSELEKFRQDPSYSPNAKIF